MGSEDQGRAGSAHSYGACRGEEGEEAGEEGEEAGMRPLAAWPPSAWKSRWPATRALAGGPLKAYVFTSIWFEVDLSQCVHCTRTPVSSRFVGNCSTKSLVFLGPEDVVQGSQPRSTPSAPLGVPRGCRPCARFLF